MRSVLIKSPKGLSTRYGTRVPRKARSQKPKPSRKAPIKPIKNIAVLTSGGDSPGENIYIYDIVNFGGRRDLRFYGYQWGFEGLIDGKVERLTRPNVHERLLWRNTLLGTSRSHRFKSKEFRDKAFKRLRTRKDRIDALIGVGGNGTLLALKEFQSEHPNFPMYFVPASIDDDILESRTIGFNTAVNNGVELIRKLYSTSSSLPRGFFVEVMGRYSGRLALEIATGNINPDLVLLPEIPVHIDALCERLEEHPVRGWQEQMVIVAEGAKIRGSRSIRGTFPKGPTGPYLADLLTKEVLSRTNLVFRSQVLGHLLRGGPVVPRDSIWASIIARATVDQLLKGEGGKLIGVQDEKSRVLSLEDCSGERRPLGEDRLEEARDMKLILPKYVP